MRKLNKEIFNDAYDAVQEVARKHPTANVLDLLEVLLYLSIFLGRRYAKPGKENAAVESLDQTWQHLVWNLSDVESAVKEK